MRRWSDPGKASRTYRRQQAHGIDSLFKGMLSQLAVAEVPSVQPTIHARAPSLVSRLRAASRAVQPALAAHLRSLSRAASPRRRQLVVSAQGSQAFPGSGSFSDMGGSLGSGSSSGLEMTPLVPARPAGASLQAQLQARAQARAKRIAQGLGAESGTAGRPGAQEQWMTSEAGAHTGGRTAYDSQNLGRGDDESRRGVNALRAGRAGLRRSSPQPRAAAPDQLQAELLREFRTRRAAGELQAGAQRQAGSARDAATLHASPAARNLKDKDIASQGASSALGHALHEAAPSLQAQLQANFQARAERARRARLETEGATAASIQAASTSSGTEIAPTSQHGGAAPSFQDQLQASLRQRTERAKQRRAAPTSSHGASTSAGSGRRGGEPVAHVPGGGHLHAQPEPPSRQGLSADQHVAKAQHVAIGRPARRA